MARVLILLAFLALATMPEVYLFGTGEATLEKWRPQAVVMRRRPLFEFEREFLEEMRKRK